MVGLVDDLLLLAQLDQGRPLASAKVDLSVMLGDLIHDTTVANPQRSIGVDIAPGLLVTGDPDRLSQVCERHTHSGHHVTHDVPFPDWVPSRVRAAARALSEEEALAAFAVWMK